MKSDLLTSTQKFRKELSSVFYKHRLIYILIGCQCGITNTCSSNGKACNCDTNDYEWRFDSGFVTERNRLPLTEVRVGDTGQISEIMKYTIGPVECLQD